MIKSFIQRGVTRLTIRTILIIWSVIVIYPLIWTIQTSLKSNREFYQSIWALPRDFQWENYVRAWNQSNVSTYFFNSVYVSAFALIISVIIIALAANALGRFENRITKFLSTFFILAYMIPGSIAIIAQFFLLRNLGLTNSLNGLGIKYIADSIPFSLFVLTAFFRTLPKELEESSEIDGASYLQTFLRIMLPLAKPGILTIAIFNFLGFWNEYFFALIMMQDRAKYTLSVGIGHMVAASAFRPEWGALFAACVIVMIPSIIVYTIFQNAISEGITGGAVKG